MITLSSFGKNMSPETKRIWQERGRRLAMEMNLLKAISSNHREAIKNALRFIDAEYSEIEDKAQAAEQLVLLAVEEAPFHDLQAHDAEVTEQNANPQVGHKVVSCPNLVWSGQWKFQYLPLYTEQWPRRRGTT